MKKIIIITVAAVAILAANNHALAYDTNDASVYFQVDDARITASGDLQVSWQKKCAGISCAGIPVPGNGICTSASYLYLTINGTTTPKTPDEGGFMLAGAGAYNSYGGWSAPTSYGGASYAPNGNTVTGSTIWDASLNASVPTSNIIATNPTAIIYANLGGFSLNTLGCGVLSYQYFAPSNPYYTFYINAEEVPFSWQYVTPASGSTIGNFTNWNGIINSNATDNPTTTVSIAFGPTTSTMNTVVSSTFYLNVGNNAITIPNSFDFAPPQLSATSSWFYAATVQNASATVTYPATHFTVSPTSGGGVCDQVSNVSLINPFPSSTIVNDFTKWGASTPQLLEGCSYTLLVTYLPQGLGSIVPASDHTTITVTPDNNPQRVSFVKSRNIWNFYNATTTKINYTVQLMDNADGVVVGSDIGSFYLAYSATSSPLTIPAGFDSGLPCGGVCNNFGTIGSGVGAGSIGTPTSTIANGGAHCSPAADWTDIGGGIAYAFCSTINWLFVPNETTNGILAGDMDSVQKVPPFSWFFATNNAIMNAANSTDHLTPNLGVTYEVTGSSVIPTSSVTIIPADMASLTGVVGTKWQGFINAWFNFLLTAIIIMCVIMLYKIVL